MHLTRLLVLTLPVLRVQLTPTSCRCGHISMAHEHYRRGSDCSLCECLRYKGQRQRLPFGGPREHSGHEHTGAA